MNNIFKIALVTEFIVCFSCITLLWIGGCFGALYLVTSFFSNLKDGAAGILFLLWIVAGGIGLTGMIKLSFHILQTYDPIPNTQQPNRAVYLSVFTGIFANLILNFMAGNFWYSAPTPDGSLALLIFNAPIICALHFVWLSFRRDPHSPKDCWIKPCSPKPQQT